MLSHKQVRNVPAGAKEDREKATSPSLSRHKSRTEVLRLERRRILREQVLRQADEARGQEKQQQATDQPTMNTKMMEPKNQEHLPFPPHIENENQMSFSTPVLSMTRSPLDQVQLPPEQTHCPIHQQDTEQLVSAIRMEPSQEYLQSPPRKQNVNQVSFSTPTLSTSQSPSHQTRLPSKQSNRPPTPSRLKEKNRQPIVQRLGTNEPLSPNRRHLSVEVRLGVSPPVTCCSASVVASTNSRGKKNQESQHNYWSSASRKARSRSPFRARLSPMSLDTENIETGSSGLSAPRSRSPFAGRTYRAGPRTPTDGNRPPFLPSLTTTSLLEAIPQVNRASPESGRSSSFWERTHSPARASFLTADDTKATSLDNTTASKIAPFSAPSVSSPSSSSPRSTRGVIESIKAQCESMSSSTAHPPDVELATRTTTKPSSTIMDNTAPTTSYSASPTPVMPSSRSPGARSTQEVLEKIKAQSSSITSATHTPKDDLKTTTTKASPVIALSNPVSPPSNSSARSAQQVIEKVNVRSSTRERFVASRRLFLETKHPSSNGSISPIAESKVDTPRRQRSHSVDWRRRRRENEAEIPSVRVEGNDEKRQQRSKSAPRMLRSSVSPRVAEATAMLFSKRSESFSSDVVSALNERKRNGFEMPEQGKVIQLERIRQYDESLERNQLNTTKTSGTYSSAGFESSKKWSSDDMELNVSTAQTDSTSESRSQEDEGVLSREDASESDACLGQKLLSKLDEVEGKILARLKSSSPGGIYRQRTESRSPPTTVEVTTLSSRDYVYAQATILMTSSSRDASCDFEMPREAVQVWSTTTTATELLPSSPSPSPFDIRHSSSLGSPVLTTKPTTSPSGLSMFEKLAVFRSEAITTSTKTPFTYQYMSASSQHADQFGTQAGDSRNDRAISPSTISTLSISCCSSVSSVGIARPYPLKRVIHTQPFREKFDALAAFSGTSNISESSSTIRTSNYSGHPRKFAPSFHSSHQQQTPLRHSSLLRRVSPSQVVVLKQRDRCPSSKLNTARFSSSLRENERELQPSSCESIAPISGSNGDSSHGIETNVRSARQAAEFRDHFKHDEHVKEQYEQQVPCLSQEARIHSMQNDLSHDDDQDLSFDTICQLHSTTDTTQDIATFSLVATTANEHDTFNSSMHPNERLAKETNSATDDEQPRHFKLNGEDAINSSQWDFEDEKNKDEHESVLPPVRFSRLQVDVNGLDPVVNSTMTPILKSTDSIHSGHADDEVEEVAISWRFQEPYSPIILNKDSAPRDVISNLQPVSKLEPFCYQTEGEEEKKEESESWERQFPPLHIFDEPRWTESKLLWNSLRKTTRDKNGAIKKIEYEDKQQLQRDSHTMGLVSKTQPQLSEKSIVTMSADISSTAKSKLLSMVQAPGIIKEEETKLRNAKIEARRLWEQESRDLKNNACSKRT